MESAFHMASHDRLEEKADQLLAGQSRLESRFVALEIRAGLLGSVAGSLCGAVVGVLIK